MVHLSLDGSTGEGVLPRGGRRFTLLLRHVPSPFEGFSLLVKPWRRKPVRSGLSLSSPVTPRKNSLG